MFVRIVSSVCKKVRSVIAGSKKDRDALDLQLAAQAFDDAERDRRDRETRSLLREADQVMTRVRFG